MDRERLLDFSVGEAPEGVSAWLPGFGPGRDLTVTEPDARWPDDYAFLAARITGALGATALDVDHVGSTSVPGLAAKPIIDIVVVVADPDDEPAYIPALVDAGFIHVVREPWWQGHRLLRHESVQTNLHVFGPDSSEVARLRIMRDWLRNHPEDRARYVAAKHAAAAGGGHVMEYNERKADALREILVRAIMSAT